MWSHFSSLTSGKYVTHKLSDRDFIYHYGNKYALLGPHISTTLGYYIVHEQCGQGVVSASKSGLAITYRIVHTFTSLYKSLLVTPTDGRFTCPPFTWLAMDIHSPLQCTPIMFCCYQSFFATDKATVISFHFLCSIKWKT